MGCGGGFSGGNSGSGCGAAVFDGSGGGGGRCSSGGVVGGWKVKDETLIFSLLKCLELHFIQVVKIVQTVFLCRENK